MGKLKFAGHGARAFFVATIVCLGRVSGVYARRSPRKPTYQQHTAISGVAEAPGITFPTAPTAVFLLPIVAVAVVLFALAAATKGRRFLHIAFASTAAAVLCMWGVQHMQHLHLRGSTIDVLRGVARPAPSSANVPRRSLRAGPAVVSVEWPSLIPVVDHVGRTLWSRHRALTADLQAVLLYDQGGYFQNHRDQLEHPTQVAVLVVDLGFRPSGPEYNTSSWRWKGSEEQAELTIDPPTQSHVPEERRLTPFHWAFGAGRVGGLPCAVGARSPRGRGTTACRSRVYCA